MPSLLSCHYLIRHGETAWSLSGLHAGLTDIPLTGQSERDARKLAKWSGAAKSSWVFTSLLGRARQTVEPAALDYIAEIEPNLAEWRYGDYEEQCPVDIRKARQNSQQSWSIDPVASEQNCSRETH
jgi:broad specificity phosphatase PhoE